MADKEATVYIVDVGRSMGERRNGRSETDLEWCMKYVWDKITAQVQRTHDADPEAILTLLLQVATGRKTLLQGVIGLRTDGKRSFWTSGHIRDPALDSHSQAPTIALAKKKAMAMSLSSSKLIKS